MLKDLCSIDGEIVSADGAVVQVDNIAFTYGHGVYENLKVRHGLLHWPEEHVRRLFLSAETIGLPIPYGADEIMRFLHAFTTAVGKDAYNVKVLFVDNTLYIFARNPRYIPSSAYTRGVKTLLVDAERPFPNAKTLSMLTSYLAYEKAREEGAYDALLVDADGQVREGSRSNLFYTDGSKLYTAPARQVLEGVTRKHVMRVCAERGIDIEERTLKRDELSDYEGYFLTSTSAKVLPIASIGELAFDIPAITEEVMASYEEYVKKYRKKEGG